ncbi:sensor histidine kinase [Arcanobacterium buesumense]|uniref:Signal transduction histidine-protein kinase/phosphatase MprB n=1 Tax=Arcanobacterium buesumense TaxID=2722751 RepID=A0A6H2EMN8_9ACTO|nr:HAMP domain-containing sensor histidine kinase [Arcanobacterium buesumense]QJC22345.1 HAMP domain-containing histidine kinase [Arcanobacterium buesumense]
MRERTITLVRVAVAVSVLLLAVPGMLLGSYLIWKDAETTVEVRSQAVVEVIGRLELNNSKVWPNLLDSLAESSRLSGVHISVTYPDGQTIESLNPAVSSRFELRRFSPQGALVTISAPKYAAIANIARLLGAVAILVVAAFLVGAYFARQRARILSDPLVLLAATAEQIGAGQVRPRMPASGIEEIDLVYQELERTASRMASRIAAERQFAADAAHQLRTPLTALSMRIEEIQMLADDPDIVEESERALEQIDRLGGVVTELMRTSTTGTSGTTEIVNLRDICTQQYDEWEPVFRNVGRTLVFNDGDYEQILATPGSLSQILATLIENSLKYGAGTTTITPIKAGRMVHIKVRDEGPGVPDELGDSIFLKGVSTGGSTGIGLAVARELASNDGGRLELTVRKPAEFTLTLAAAPQQMEASQHNGHATLISLRSRRRRR